MTEISDITAGVAFTCFSIKSRETCLRSSSFVPVFVLVYLIDSPPADDPYGLDQVGEGRLRCQEDGALEVSTQEVGVIWSCAVRGEKIKHDNENLVWFCSFVVVCVCVHSLQCLAQHHV